MGDILKKFDFDKKYVQITILAIIVIIFGTAFMQMSENITIVLQTVKKALDFTTELLRPFIIGFIFAYFLNPIVRTIENTSFIKHSSFFKRQKKKRMFSVFVTYIFALFCFYLLLVSILPSVINNVNTLIVVLPESLNSAKDILDKYSNVENSTITPIIDIINTITNQDYSINHLIVNAVKNITDVIFNLPQMFVSLVGGVVTLANGVISLVLGFVISIYMINDKEYFLEQIKKFIYVCTKKHSTKKIFKIARLSNNILEKFIIGKAIDSFIIGIMFFIICLAFKIPYAPLFAIIMGVTNMIPYFGPFIGALPILLITITWNYKMAIPIGVAILLIQQFDGIILGPKILGDSIGLKPISTIFAILIGGGLFGVYGMFLGAPVYAVIATIVNEVVNKNYDKIKLE